MSFFFFKQKTAYEMRISDWGSDVCSSDLFFLGESRVPIFALVEEGFARPDLLHDEERFAHHVVEMLGVLIFFLDAVPIGSERIGAGADPHKIAAFEEPRTPADGPRPFGRIMVRPDMRHRSKGALLGLQTGGIGRGSGKEGGGT